MNVVEVSAAPTKSFFVSMLTRDIKLEDAVLDLLDNCVDGILRSGIEEVPKPYAGFHAEIRFDAESFSISDNCGGIPQRYHEHAFRMGRPPGSAAKVDGSVGVYGIGMKRAMFKIGRRCSISTRNANERYNIDIDPEWMEKEDDWKIYVRGPTSTKEGAGTTITVRDLHDDIAGLFTENEGKEYFSARLVEAVSANYAYIINKGFKVMINGHNVKPETIKIAYNENWERGNAIVPFVFKGEMDGVEVYLAVGLTRKIPAADEIDKEQEGKRSSKDAGWTVVCNDRAVIYCDRTELTGWGEAGVPKYHTQFIAISGIVEFKSKDPSALPTTTTKRGIDASSSLYLQVKNKMREGMQVFTAYTNQWKSEAKESEKHIVTCKMLPLADLKEKTKALRFSGTQTLSHGKQHKPRLPSPSARRSKKCRITYYKDKKEVNAVAEYIDEPDMSPNEIGEECFDRTFKGTKR